MKRNLKRLCKDMAFRAKNICRENGKKWLLMPLNLTTLKRLRKLGLRSHLPKIKSLLSPKQALLELNGVKRNNLFWGQNC